MADASAGVRGMLTLEQLRERISTGELDTVVVGFTDHYGRLMGKRYDAETLGVRTVATGDVHAHHPRRARLHVCRHLRRARHLPPE